MSTSPFNLPIEQQQQQQQERRGGRFQPQTAATDHSNLPSAPSHLYNNHSTHSNNSHNKNNNNNTDSSSPFTTNTAAFQSPYGGLKQESLPYEQGQPFSGFSSYSPPLAQQPSSFWTPPLPPPTLQTSPYNSSSNTNLGNYHPYQQQPPAIQLTADDYKPTYPWRTHPSAASSISVSDLPNAAPTQTTTSHFHPQNYSERRKLIHSFQSSADSTYRPQTPIMESRPSLLLSNNGHSNGNKDGSRPTGAGGICSPRRSLESLSGSRPDSPGLNKTAKKPFWMSFPRRFRPKGAVRPKKADSIGNKKAKFSNERTLVHWIKAAMLLGSLSMTLLSFGENQVTPYIGAVLITICCMTLVYSVTTFQVRMEWLEMRRDDVIYYDRLAPTILTGLLMLTFGFNAVVALTGDFTSSKDYLKKKGFDG